MIISLRLRFGPAGRERLTSWCVRRLHTSSPTRPFTIGGSVTNGRDHRAHLGKQKDIARETRRRVREGSSVCSGAHWPSQPWHTPAEKELSLSLTSAHRQCLVSLFHHSFMINAIPFSPISPLSHTSCLSTLLFSATDHHIYINASVLSQRRIDITNPVQAVVGPISTIDTTITIAPHRYHCH
jgi:hypothetical protein